MAMNIGIVIGVLVIVLVIFVMTRPDTFRYERSAQINAPANVVFGLINNFQEWRQWSPWEKKDPNMERSYSGPSAGPGAVYAWAGNKDVGEGRMTVIESKVGEFILIKLEFFKPFAAQNQARFTFKPVAGGTLVNWSMEGKANLVGKMCSLFMDMEKMIGKDFEKGLADLNVAAQTVALGWKDMQDPA